MTGQDTERILVDVGLRPYEARVLAALAERGDGNTVELAEATGVPRTSIYGCMSDLVESGLAVKLATVGTARWRSDWQTVVDGLTAVGAERAREGSLKVARLAAHVGR